jgi:hypothetical protein
MLVLSLLACGGPDKATTPLDTGPVATTEPGGGLDRPERVVSGGDPSRDEDASGAQLCLAGEQVYVLYVVVGDDGDALYVTASDDTGDTWLEEPVRLGAVADVSNPHLHCDDGGVVVAWEEVRHGVDDNHQIYVNRSVDGGLTWLAEDVRVDDDPDGRAMSLQPRLAAGGGGLVVAWYDNTFGAYDIFVSRSDDGGASWGPPVRVDSDPAGASYSARPKVAMSEDGMQVWVAWEDSRNGRADVYAARSGDGGQSFEPDVRLDTGDPPGASDAFEVQLCTDGVGELYVVWHDARAGTDAGRDIYASWSDDGGVTWSATDVRVDTSAVASSNALFPACAWVDGALHVAWQENEVDAYDIFHRTLVDGAPVGSEERLDLGSPAGEANSLEATVVTDGTDVVVAWRDGRHDDVERGYAHLFFNVAPVGGAFDTTDHPISTFEEGESYKLDLHVAVRDGTLLSVWTDGRSGTSDVFFRRVSLP